MDDADGGGTRALSDGNPERRAESGCATHGRGGSDAAVTKGGQDK